MFKTAAAVAALTTILSGAAMAQAVTVGQYVGTQQYTGLIDPAGICASLGVATGQTFSSVGTVAGLGNAWSAVIANAGDGSAADAYGVTPIACTLAPLPAASTFSNGVSNPTGPQVSTCATSKGTFTLTGANDSSSGSTYAVNLVTLPKGSKDSSFGINAVNTVLAAGGTTLCYLSISQQFSYSGL